MRRLVSPLGVLTFVACSSTSSPSGTSYLSWSMSDNGTIVLDSAGNKYQFDASKGCMFLANGGPGPANFCLTSIAAASNQATGPTNCLNPASNPECNISAFRVVLTPDPANKSGCIAVLGTATTSSTIGDAIQSSPISVTITSAGAAITQVNTSSAYVLYDSGQANIIPICGGTNPYVGSYSAAIPAGVSRYCGILAGQFDAQPACTLNFTVDSGGNINFDAPSSGLGGITGTIASNGTGSLSSSWTTTNLGSDEANIAITGATKNSSGKWVLAMGAFSATEN